MVDDTEKVAYQVLGMHKLAHNFHQLQFACARARVKI